MSLFASITSNIAFACGAAIVSYFLIRRSRSYFARSASDSSTRSNLPAENSRNAVMPFSTTDNVPDHVDLHETARDLMGRLDSKMAILQTLIRLADEASARLESAVARAERLGVAARRDTLEDLANLPASDQTSAAQWIEGLSVDGRRTRIDPQHHVEMVLHLAQEGRSAQSIASELGIAIGDVEMLLSLHRRQ